MIRAGIPHSCREERHRRSGWRPVLAVMCTFTLVLPAMSLAGEDCSVERHGQPAYERVTEKVREKLPNIEQFVFKPFDEVQISVLPDCVLKLHGGFSFKKQRNQEVRVYDAEVTPKSGAPSGIKILKLRIGAP